MDLDNVVKLIIDDLINGNLTDALNRVRSLNSLQAGYVMVQVFDNELFDNESFTTPNKRWMLNAMYNGN